MGQYCGLGLYEKIIARIGGIQRTVSPRTDRRSLVLFFSDNGIARCGVSQSDAEVTHKVALATAQGKSVASVMAQKADIGVVPIDIGMKGEKMPGLVIKAGLVSCDRKMLVYVGSDP